MPQKNENRVNNVSYLVLWDWFLNWKKHTLYKINYNCYHGYKQHVFSLLKQSQRSYLFDGRFQVHLFILVTISATW